MKWYKIIQYMWSVINSIWVTILRTCGASDQFIWEWSIVRVILDREEKNPYLVRYYLFNTRFLTNRFFGTLFPFLKKYSRRLVLHNTLRSDIDGLHDHPWDWGSKLLSGGYWEHTPEGKFWRSSKDGWRFRKKEDLHRLELDPEMANGEETWSLFWMCPTERKWGFLDKDGNWVYWREYIDNREKYAA